MSAQVIAVAAPVTLRDRPASIDPQAVYCSSCWEPIAHDGEMWRHVRTGASAHWNDKQCAPLCDWPGCDEPAPHAIRRQVFSGSQIEWRTDHFVCSTHRDAYARMQVVIEHT